MSLDLSSFDTSLVANMEYMFYGCTTLQTLTLSSNFVSLKVVKMNHMFYECSKLQLIIL